jgi:hypothetical protein
LTPDVTTVATVSSVVTSAIIAAIDERPNKLQQLRSRPQLQQDNYEEMAELLLRINMLWNVEFRLLVLF